MIPKGTPLRIGFTMIGTGGIGTASATPSCYIRDVATGTFAVCANSPRQAKLPGGSATYAWDILLSGTEMNANSVQFLAVAPGCVTVERTIVTESVWTATRAGYIDMAISDVATSVWNSVTSREVTGGTVDNVLGAVNDGSPFATRRTYTLLRSDNGQPIADAEIKVSTDANGLNIVAGPKRTNAFGTVGFKLQPGTYYFWRFKSGFNFTDPDTETFT